MKQNPLLVLSENQDFSTLDLLVFKISLYVSAIIQLFQVLVILLLSDGEFFLFKHVRKEKTCIL